MTKYGKMIVISDSTPIITLMKANHLEILNKLFCDVFVPNAVFHELTDNERFTEEATLIGSAYFQLQRQKKPFTA